MSNNMYIQKRNGESQKVSFDKILYRLQNLSDGLNVNTVSVAQKVIAQIYDNIKTSELDELAGQICISLLSENLDYGKLASNIIISNNHKNTSPSFSEAMTVLYNNYDNDIHKPLISKKIYDVILKNKDKLNSIIKYERDYDFNYFAFKTLEKAYLLKKNGKIIERIQHLFMRVSLGIHFEDIQSVIKSYNYMSQKYFIHATPTLYHSGTKQNQLASCFLMGTEDSVGGIYKTLTDCAHISKVAGGIGIHISNIRGNGSYISGTNGYSSGIIPMAKVYNETARYINQSGRRPGSFALYLEPHHVDIMEFLELKKNHGNENERARDLFLALWISDLFMERVKKGEMWSLFNEHDCPGLMDAYGDEFKRLYEKYEKEKKYVKQIPVRKIWEAILNSQIETGTPYMLFKDNINNKSNQKNVGTIKSSNLCVSGDTNILTENGYFKIKDLSNKNINVWNGKEFSETIVKKTGVDQELLQIKFTNGLQLKCTPYHKFYIIDKKENTKKIEAKELKEGMNLIEFDLPVIKNNDKKLDNPYKHGLFCADSKLDNKNNEKCIIPINYNLESKIRWLEGYFDCNGFISKNNDLLQVISNNNDFSKKILLLLQTLGIHSRISTLQKENTEQEGLYKCKKTYRLLINSHNLYKLLQLGFNPKRLKINMHKPNRESSNYIKIKSIKELEEREDTYCFTEKKLGRGIFNGVITGNCAEIVEYSNNKEYAVCTLASIGLSRYVDEYDYNQIKNINIYTKEDCKYCKYTKEYLTKLGLKYKEFDITEGDNRDELVKKIGEDFKTVPQIFVEIKEEKHVGGYYDLVGYFKPTFNFEKLIEIMEIVVRNLNKVIDVNYYPVPETEVSNKRHRPMGVGVQGLADVFAKMRIPFDSDEGRKLNRNIFETMYYGAMRCSHKLSLEEGEYSTFRGSPLSEGKFQFDLWETKPEMGYDWDKLRKDIMRDGVRNSLCLALMPTASTSQILGNNECFEPFTSNIYVRRTIAGDFMVINKYLIKDLIDMKLWNKDMKDQLIYYNGSIQQIDKIPDKLKKLYKTAWEMKQKAIIDQAIERGPYVCQTQSMNLFFEEPTHKMLTSAFFYGWSKGLKTGSYYIRSRPKVQAQQFTLDINKIKQLKNKETKYDVCESCSG